MNRRALLLIATIVLGLLLIGGLVTVFLKSSSKNAANDPSKVVSITDKDTGAVINYYPNQNKEISSQGFVLLNGEELANFLGPGQYQVVSDQIKSIIEAKTGQVASMAKIMPGSVAWDRQRDVINAKVKQDSPNLEFIADIKLLGAGQAAVTAQ